MAEVDKYGWVAERLDLYAAQFSSQLTAEERKSYYLPEFDRTAVSIEIEQLQRADILVLVFPTWWFGFPAILKGWFDRVWAPGVAFAHADDLKSIKPLLSRLRWVLAVTTLGAPHWVDRLVLRRPVRRVLKTALVGACAPQAGFSMKTLYRAEAVDTVRVIDFENKVRAAIRAIARRLA